MTNSFKYLPGIKVKTVVIVTVIQAILLFFSAVFSLGDSSDPSHKYPIDAYFKIFAFPVGFLFRKHSLLFVGIDWILYAIVTERIIAIAKYSKQRPDNL